MTKVKAVTKKAIKKTVKKTVEKKEIKRPIVGIFSMTSCSGCQIRMLDMEDWLVDLFRLCNVVHFPLVKKHEHAEHYDIAIIEGAVTTDEELRKVKFVREHSTFVIALGTCATYGGIPSIKDYGYREEIEKTVYPEPVPFIHNLGVCGVYPHIKIDYFLRGCPPDKDEIKRVLLDLINGKKMPRNYDDPVCVECRMRGNDCFLQKGLLCMGPVTYAGCKAICPSIGFQCYGCRGPLDDANVHSLIQIFENCHVSEDEIRRMFIKFAGTSKKFREAHNLCKITVKP
jgi:sulfhydrogenase subunit delta